jgi:hypothetical protein
MELWSSRRIHLSLLMGELLNPQLLILSRTVSQLYHLVTLMKRLSFYLLYFVLCIDCEISVYTNYWQMKSRKWMYWVDCTLHNAISFEFWVFHIQKVQSNEIKSYSHLHTLFHVQIYPQQNSKTIYDKKKHLINIERICFFVIVIGHKEVFFKLNISSDAIIWLNDLEKDVVYNKWPRDVHNVQIHSHNSILFSQL